VRLVGKEAGDDLVAAHLAQDVEEARNGFSKGLRASGDDVGGAWGLGCKVGSQAGVEGSQDGCEVRVEELRGLLEGLELWVGGYCMSGQQRESGDG